LAELNSECREKGEREVIAANLLIDRISAERKMLRSVLTNTSVCMSLDKLKRLFVWI